MVVRDVVEVESGGCVRTAVGEEDLRVVGDDSSVVGEGVMSVVADGDGMPNEGAAAVVS
jgi:hypothetical protein